MLVPQDRLLASVVLKKRGRSNWSVLHFFFNPRSRFPSLRTIAKSRCSRRAISSETFIFHSSRQWEEARCRCAGFVRGGSRRSRAINRMHSKRNEAWAAREIFKPRPLAFIWWNFRIVRPIRYTHWERADTRLMVKRRRKLTVIVMISAFRCVSKKFELPIVFLINNRWVFRVRCYRIDWIETWF